MIMAPSGGSNGGMRPNQEQEPPYWLVYFGSDDIDATVGKASQAGAKELLGVTDIGMGKIAILQDPQGAVFALFSGQFGE
jgi:hypothetical protein